MAAKTKKMDEKTKRNEFVTRVGKDIEQYEQGATARAAKMTLAFGERHGEIRQGTNAERTRILTRYGKYLT